MKVYTITWINTSYYDDLSAQCKGAFTNKDKAMNYLNKLLDDIKANYENDYDEDNYKYYEDDSMHYIVTNNDGQYDEVIFTELMLDEGDK